MSEIHASENIRSFIRFIHECKALNEMAKEGISTEDKRQQDLLHEIEFEPRAKERSKLCTKLHLSRKERRRYKDIFEETDDIVQFFNTGNNKKMLEQMNQLIGKVRKVEKYHVNRTYIPRLKEGDENGQECAGGVCRRERGNQRST